MNQIELIRKLTDVFNKNPNSKIGKFLQIVSEQLTQVQTEAERIERWRDIDQAEGTTLDEIGAPKGQQRGKANDEVMRALIKTRIAQNNSDGTIDTLVQFLSTLLKLPASEIGITSMWEEGFHLAPLNLDFKGKVSGSTVENPHVSKGMSNNSLAIPSVFTSERDTSAYANISTLNGISHTLPTATNGAIAQQLFSFNLIAATERKYGRIPGVTVAEKVAWLKANVERLSASWYGFGSSVGGNKATLSSWLSTAWSGSTSHALASVNPLKINTAISRIDATGFLHYLANSDPSNGTIPSVINTDYINLEMTFKKDADILGVANRKYANIHVNVPAGAINATGLTLKQFGQLVNVVAASGIKAHVLFEGTFSFSSDYYESEFDDNAGFANDAQTIGGTMGYIYDPAIDVELPI